MKLEQIQNNNLENSQDLNNREGLEKSEKVRQLLSEAEKTIDNIAEEAVKEEADEITQKLIALGATGKEVESVLARIKTVDSKIEDAKQKTLQSFSTSVDKFYSENFQHLGKSLMAEIKMRPIYKKYISLDKENFKKYERKMKNEKKNRPDDSGYDDNVNMVHDIFQNSENFNKIPEFVSKNKLNETNIHDIETYQDSYQYRRNVFEKKFRSPLSIHDENESDILARLYAVQLNQVRNKLKNNDRDIEKNLDVFFRPAAKKYVDAKSSGIFSEKNADLSNTWYSSGIVDRIEAFVKALENDQTVLSEEQKGLLRRKVIDIFKNSSDDLSQNFYGIKKLEKFIDICEFTDEQKSALNLNLFNIMLANERDPVGLFLDNPQFPYTEDQTEKVFNIIKQLEMDEDGIRIKGRNGNIDHVSIGRLTNFPFTEVQKNALREPVFNSKKEKIISFSQTGNYLSLTWETKNKSSDFLTQIQNDELREIALSLIPETAKKYLDVKIANCNTSISNALELKDILKDTPEEFKDEVKTLIEERKILWQDDLEKMLNIQKRSRRNEYDLWVNAINPLVSYEIRQGVLSLDKKEDGAILLEYIKKVGAKNLPDYFKLFADIKRSGSIDTMSQELKDTIKNSFSIDADKICEKDPKNLNLVMNEMEKYRQSFATNLMNENTQIIDQVLKSDIVKEFLTSIKGNSGHSQGGTLEQVLSTYEKSMQKNPELFKLKEGYEVKQVEIGEYQEKTELDEQEIQKQSEGILLNPDLVTYYEKIYKAIEPIQNDLSFTQRLNTFSYQINSEFEEEKIVIDSKIKEEELKENKNEKALENLKKRQVALSDQQKAFSSFNPESSTELPLLMENYNKLIPDNIKSKANLILELSMQDILKRFPDQVSRLNNKELLTEKPTADGVSTLTEFVRSHVGEHYLDKKHGEEQAIKTEDKALLKYLKKAWGTQDFEKGILAITENKLDSLEKGEVSEKKKTITMIPSKGMQRIFSGDLGGACTSRRNLELAKGEYKNITSYSLVLDKDTPKEKFAGSFLVVETETADKKPILILRANNPQQNLSQMIDTDELISKTIEEVKKVAERRGISQVGVAYNQGSASNRSFVVDYYKNNFSSDNALELQRTSDTTFNGYDIYKKSGSHFTVLV